MHDLKKKKRLAAFKLNFFATNLKLELEIGRREKETGLCFPTSVPRWPQQPDWARLKPGGKNFHLSLRTGWQRPNYLSCSTLLPKTHEWGAPPEARELGLVRHDIADDKTLLGSRGHNASPTFKHSGAFHCSMNSVETLCEGARLLYHGQTVML